MAAPPAPRVRGSLRDFAAREAWDPFFARHHGAIVRIAQRAGLGPQDAQDAAQETLLAFAQSYRAGLFDPSRGRLDRWLYGIAMRQIRATRRRGLRPRPCNESDLGERASLDRIPAADDDEARWDAEWRRSVLARALAQVRQEVEPRTLAIFELVACQGRPVPEVMARLGVTRTVVYNARHRVGRRLEQLVTGLLAA